MQSQTNQVSMKSQSEITGQDWLWLSCRALFAVERLSAFYAPIVDSLQSHIVAAVVRWAACLLVSATYAHPGQASETEPVSRAKILLNSLTHTQYVR